MVARKLLSVAALAAILATGCTSENNPVSPTSGLEDTTPPAAPQGVATEGGTHGWVMSWDANSEADLAGYNVYKYDPDPSRELAYVKVNSSTITSTEYALPIEPGTWSYRVRAVDQTGNQSGFSSLTAITTGDAIGGSLPGGDEIVRGQ